MHLTQRVVGLVICKIYDGEKWEIAISQMIHRFCDILFYQIAVSILYEALKTA